MTKVQQNHLKNFNNTLILKKNKTHPFYASFLVFWVIFFRGDYLFVFQKGTIRFYRQQKNIISFIEQ